MTRQDGAACEDAGPRRKRALSKLLPPSPEARLLSLAYVISACGRGALVPCLIIYLTDIVGLNMLEVGSGLTVAGLLGLLVGIPFGHLADRKGPRRTTVIMSLLTALTGLLYLWVGSFASMMVATCLYTLMERGSSVSREALLASVITKEAVTTRAYLRSVANIGMALGAGVAGVALAVGARPVYLSVIVFNSLCLLLCALVIHRLPGAEPASSLPGPRLPVLRDRPYMAVTLLHVVMLLHIQILEVVLPVWLVRQTDAPRPLVAVLMALNTLSVIAFQVRVSRGIDSLDSALVRWRRSGLVLLAACLLFALSADRSALPASALLVAAVLVHVYAEMILSAAGWVFSLDLAPSGRQGQYQGMFKTSYPIAQMIAPTVLLPLVLGVGSAGWIVLGGVFAATGYAMVPVLRWAVRTRPDVSVPARQQQPS